MIIPDFPLWLLNLLNWGHNSSHFFLFNYSVDLIEIKFEVEISHSLIALLTMQKLQQIGPNWALIWIKLLN